MVTHILRGTATTEDEWIKGGAEEDRQGKLTGPQEDRDVFRSELQKGVSHTKGVFCKRYEALKPHISSHLAQGTGRLIAADLCYRGAPRCSKITVVACPKVESSILFFLSIDVKVIPIQLYCPEDSIISSLCSCHCIAP